MQVYLVGGAVRDQILGRAVNERDYVVVGATPEQMLKLGFSQVGADFPVFLHPHTHEEYALARTERKNGTGYLGFHVHAAPSVTLEQDLIRRDLTINAMAIEVNGLFDDNYKHGHFDLAHVVDPYGGLHDIQHRQLHHVSAAFAEDPVRVLRLARFASRYAPFGFGVAEQTQALVKTMKAAGALNQLVAERVWAETLKALSQDWADLYFNWLNRLSVLDAVMPALSQVACQKNWHPALAALRLAGQFQADTLIKFALLATVFCPSYLTDFEQFCTEQKVPKAFSQFAAFFIHHLPALDGISTLTPNELFELFMAANALKDTARINQALTASHIYQLSSQLNLIKKLQQELSCICAKDVCPTLQGKQIGEAIEQLRRQRLADIVKL